MGWHVHHPVFIEVKHLAVQLSIETSLLSALPQLHVPLPSELRQNFPKPVWQIVASLLVDAPLFLSWWERACHPVFLMRGSEGSVRGISMLTPSNRHPGTYLGMNLHRELEMNDLSPDNSWGDATSDELRKVLESFCDGRVMKKMVPNASPTMHASRVLMRLSVCVPLLLVGVVDGDAARGLLSVVGDMLGAIATMETTLGEFYIEFTTWEHRAQDSVVDAGIVSCIAEVACPPVDRGAWNNSCPNSSTRVAVFCCYIVGLGPWASKHMLTDSFPSWSRCLPPTRRADLSLLGPSM
mmetsp:Transcript_25122/g.83806  ORF Transcript_25122/g.83806 Transcript_25122/m.83806 type:complete len:296 (+) Transcript_25122:88-975(+)